MAMDDPDPVHHSDLEQNSLLFLKHFSAEPTLSQMGIIASVSIVLQSYFHEPDCYIISLKQFFIIGT